MLKDSQFFRRIAYRLRFPKLLASSKAEIGRDGSLIYGSNVRINEDARILPLGGGQISLGSDVYVGRSVEIATWGRLTIGPDTSVQDRSVLVGQVNIGAHCLLSYGIMAASGSHVFELHPHLLIRDQDILATSETVGAKPICVDDDCWIGAHSVIVGGVRIGRGCVIGAGSVVTNDVPPYWVVGGVPAKRIRQRFAFSPPSLINVVDERSWPYLYSGFDLRRNTAHEAIKLHGGVFAQRVFRLAIADSVGALAIEVKVTFGHARLRYAGDERDVGSEFKTLFFNASATETQIHEFVVGEIEDGAETVVRKAWIDGLG